MRKEIQACLERLSEPEYRAFNEKLLPGVPNICGVRLPKLREMAKQIAKTKAWEYLAQMQAVDWSGSVCYYEEKMLFGLVIGYARMDDSERQEQLDIFVPLIDNWGVCDSCCMTYKWMRKRPEFWWDYLNGWICAGTEFGVRFGLVAMLDHFVDQAHLQDIFQVCSQLHAEGYYAKMAAAWLLSVCFANFPEETYAYLQKDPMDDFTHNKSIQKACESYRVSKEWKALLHSLRRKKATA